MTRASRGGGLTLRGAPPPRRTAAEEVADLLRKNIFDGHLPPGSALPEVEVAEQFQVSRNTVREAFRALMNDRLLTYQAHKGVTVRALTAVDVEDIYKLRRILELGAIDLLIRREGEVHLDGLSKCLQIAEDAATEQRWDVVGTENLNFHVHLVRVHNSERVDEIFRRLMTEMRLGFLAIREPARLHAPYLQLNRTIHKLLSADKPDEVRSVLDEYLREAEKHVAGAVGGER